MLPLIELIRPRQWSKNALCLAGLAFSGKMLHIEAWESALGTFAVFCCVSSAVYALNDVRDRARDACHPIKQRRPVASGAIRPAVALLISGLFALLALVGGFWVGTAVGVCTLVYLALNLGYSMGLKHMVFIDVLCIAMGFVLRLLAGVYAVHVVPTVWITQCTFFGALFLGFAKRRAELARTKETDTDPEIQRPVLGRYSVELLDHLVESASMVTLISYSMFIVGGGRSPALVLTVPVVFFAVAHYQRLVLMDHGGEEPETLVLRNRPLQAAIALWLILYFLLWKTGTTWFA